MELRKRLEIRILSFLFIVLFFCGAAFADEVVGKVDDVVPQSWAKRDGRNNELLNDAEIFLTDVLETDKLGRLGVRFADGTTVELGANTEITVSDFSMNVADMNFTAEIGKGAARIVTGALVKRNPSGFRVTTQRGLIGIRGTTVVIIADGKGNELISILDIGKLHVTVIDRRTGKADKIDSSNYSVYFERNRGSAVLRNTEQLNTLLNTAFMREGSPENIIDLLIREAKREFVKQKPVRDNYFGTVTGNPVGSGGNDSGGNSGSGSSGGNDGGDDGGDDD